MKILHPLFLTGVIVLLWAAGLLVFADRVINSTPAHEPDAPADAIVALTGASDLRLKEGMRLLERRKGERLLISGVNRKVTRAELLDVTQGSQRLDECCVDIGYEALNTVGNAREIAEWTRARGYEALIVVTSDYHMPRTLLELRAELPETELVAYPVSTPDLDARQWWKSPKATRILVMEYSKYLAILGRNMVSGLSDAIGGSKDDGAPAPSSAA